jgi:hypothetical protein
MLLHHEINNTLYKIFFIVSLNYLQFHYLRNSFDKNYSFHDFLSGVTTSGKISSGTKLELRSNSANATLSCDLLLIYIVSLNNVKH